MPGRTKGTTLVRIGAFGPLLGVGCNRADIVEKAPVDVSGQWFQAKTRAAKWAIWAVVSSVMALHRHRFQKKNSYLCAGAKLIPGGVEEADSLEITATHPIGIEARVVGERADPRPYGWLTRAVYWLHAMIPRVAKV